MLNSIVKIKNQVVHHLAGAYIAGPNVTDAIKVCRKAEAHGWASAICPWNGPYDTTETVATNYLQALQAIRQEKMDCYLSIKVPSLKYDYSILKDLVEFARTYGIRVHFDSQDPDSCDPSFALLEKIFAIYPNIGCTLPARWQRSISDAKTIIDMKIPVRVVKGQWPDPVKPECDHRRVFLDLIDVLIGHAAHVTVATHDAALAKEALVRLKKSGTSCQLEQLFGLPLHTTHVAELLCVDVRLYVPYGHAWLPYCLSQIGKRPIILTWIIRDILLGRTRILT